MYTTHDGGCKKKNVMHNKRFLDPDALQGFVLITSKLHPFQKRKKCRPHVQSRRCALQTYLCSP